MSSSVDFWYLRISHSALTPEGTRRLGFEFPVLFGARGAAGLIGALRLSTSWEDVAAVTFERRNKAALVLVCIGESANENERDADDGLSISIAPLLRDEEARVRATGEGAFGVLEPAGAPKLRNE